MRRAKLPAGNRSKENRRSLKNLKEMKDVVVLPADKGNTTVVTNKEEYLSLIHI